MKLTKRRQQFLDTIVRLFEERGEPIHYEEVATVMGVSKWTAYDIIRALEEHDLVSIEYMVNQDIPQVGRSRIGIIPKGIVPQNLVQVNAGKCDFHSLVEKVKFDIKQLSMTELAGKVKSSKSGILSCVYVVCLLLHLLKERLSVRALSLVSALAHATDGDSGLVIAVGVVIGIILGCGVDKEYSQQLKDWFKRFQKDIGKVPHCERTYIKKLWNETIAELDV